MEGKECLLRVLNVVSGVCLVVLAVYFFISPDIGVPVDVVVPVYYVLFAILIVTFEYKVKYVQENFKFMKMRVGRSVFMLLVGGLALRVLALMNFIVAGVLVANGLLTWLWRENGSLPSKYKPLL